MSVGDTDRNRIPYSPIHNKSQSEHLDALLINKNTNPHIGKKSIISSSPEWKLYINSDQVQQLLEQVHDAGHLGMRKTVKKAQANY